MVAGDAESIAALLGMMSMRIYRGRAGDTSGNTDIRAQVGTSMYRQTEPSTKAGPQRSCSEELATCCSIPREVQRWPTAPGMASLFKLTSAGVCKW
eukprot:3034554-Amphidinium_carterae.1